MGEYGSIWENMGAYGSIRDHTGPTGSIQEQARAFRCIQEHMSYGEANFVMSKFVCMCVNFQLIDWLTQLKKHSIDVLFKYYFRK